jgi:hypothetical protein
MKQMVGQEKDVSEMSLQPQACGAMDECFPITRVKASKQKLYVHQPEESFQIVLEGMEAQVQNLIARAQDLDLFPFKIDLHCLTVNRTLSPLKNMPSAPYAVSPKEV